ncbi:MAG TPA: sodium:proton antiporter NhaD [Flavisolibacter sp.]
MITSIAIVFIAGYAAIALEHPIRINKAASALLTGVICWTIYTLVSGQTEHAGHALAEHLGEISGILFFLLGAMTIVELIDAHDGFNVITKRIQTTNKRKLVWVVAILTFFLSAVLDNLTTTIVMISLLRKLLYDKNERLFFAGLVVISANAGGAWSPIGDVTTTMLWIGGQITTVNIILKTFIPSLVCMVIPTLVVSARLKGPIHRPMVPPTKGPDTTLGFEQLFVFWLGLACLLFVPVFKTITHLPPYMGMLFALGIMWVITEIIHSGKDEEEKGLLSVNHALRKIDASSVLFFLGILLSVSALQTTGMLNAVATWLASALGNLDVITIVIGLLSSIVDNVPLVAAAQGMYPLSQYPTDHYFWEFLAYCAGTGGSTLIIGSAAGVAAMGIEKIEFIWYVKRIAWLALIGYFAGAAAFLLQHHLFFA